jgi:hypothetical protein
MGFRTAALLTTLSVVIAATPTAFAQSNSAPAAAPAGPAAQVNFTTQALMPSLADSSKKDTFTVGIDDAQVATTLTLSCQAGGTKFMVFHKDRACQVSGAGSIINPSNQQKLQRTQYAGGYTVKSDGATDASTLTINYLAVGKAPAASTPFSGSMNLRPQNTSSGAAAIRDAVLKKLNADNASGGVIDQRVDTVDISQLYIPSAGFPSDKGCTWNGNMVYAYQTKSWFMDLKANCDGKDYALKGNMPMTDTPNVEAQTQYDLTLTMPSADTATDDALFASTSGANNDLFASVNGISGQIIMKESDYVDTKVDNQVTKTPSHVDASGSLKGTGVPLDTVRSLGTLFGVLSENLFGA